MYEYLIGIGVMKSATTMLYNHLRTHPQIRRGIRKELHYFDTVEHPDKAAYDGLFTAGEGLKMDITPFYIYHEPSIERMSRVLDPEKVAVVLVLRDPVARALSHYRMRKSQGMEDQPFEACLGLEASRTSRSFHDLQLFSYFSRGLYSSQLDRLYRTFPKENIRIYLFENLVCNQQAYVDDICDFVGIRRIHVEDKHDNKTVTNVKSRTLTQFLKKLARTVPQPIRMGWMRKLKQRLTWANERKDASSKIDPAFEMVLIDYYREDVRLLKEHYGLDVSKWKHFDGEV